MITIDDLNKIRKERDAAVTSTNTVSPAEQYLKQKRAYSFSESVINQFNDYAKREQSLFDEYNNKGYSKNLSNRVNNFYNTNEEYGKNILSDIEKHKPYLTDDFVNSVKSSLEQNINNRQTLTEALDASSFSESVINQFNDFAKQEQTFFDEYNNKGYSKELSDRVNNFHRTSEASEKKILSDLEKYKSYLSDDFVNSVKNSFTQNINNRQTLTEALDRTIYSEPIGPKPFIGPMPEKGSAEEYIALKEKRNAEYIQSLDDSILEDYEYDLYGKAKDTADAKAQNADYQRFVLDNPQFRGDKFKNNEIVQMIDERKKYDLGFSLKSIFSENTISKNLKDISKVYDTLRINSDNAKSKLEEFEKFSSYENEANDKSNSEFIKKGKDGSKKDFDVLEINKVADFFTGYNLAANKVVDEENFIKSRISNSEKDTYYFIRGKYGDDEAEKYYNYLVDRIYEYDKKTDWEAKNDPNTPTALKAIYAIGATPMKGFVSATALAEDGISALIGENYNPNNNFTLNRINNSIDAASNAIGENYGEAGKFLFNTLLSIEESTLGNLAFGKANLFLMGASAAQSEAQKLYNNGASDTQMVLGSLLAGAAEVVFEKVSFDKLMTPSVATGKWDIVKDVFAQAGVEASEELFTEITNNVTNSIVMGDNSDYRRAVSEYVKNGETVENANKKALADIVVDASLAALGGFISGGVTSAAKNTFSYESRKRSAGADAISDKTVDSLLFEAKAQNDKNYDKNLDKKIKAVERKETKSSVGRLSLYVEQNLRSELETEFEKELTSTGVSKKRSKSMATELAGAMIDGTQISKNTTQFIEANKNVSDAVYSDDAVSRQMDIIDRLMGANMPSYTAEASQEANAENAEDETPNVVIYSPENNTLKNGVISSENDTLKNGVISSENDTLKNGVISSENDTPIGKEYVNKTIDNFAKDGNITEKHANLIKSVYDAELYDAKIYANGIIHGIELVKNGASDEDIANDDDDDFQSLTDSQQKLALKIGNAVTHPSSSISFEGGNVVDNTGNNANISAFSEETQELVNILSENIDDKVITESEANAILHEFDGISFDTDIGADEYFTNALEVYVYGVEAGRANGANAKAKDVGLNRSTASEYIDNLTAAGVKHFFELGVKYGSGNAENSTITISEPTKSQVQIANDVNSNNENLGIDNKWNGIEELKKTKNTSVYLSSEFASVEGSATETEKQAVITATRAIDTGIKWNWLSMHFVDTATLRQPVDNDTSLIAKLRTKARGLFDLANKRMSISNEFPNSVSHEFGHALDAYLGKIVTGDYTYLSEYRGNGGNLHALLTKFVNDIRGDDNRTSNSELFARFTARFVEWVNNAANETESKDETELYNNDFTEEQFKYFASILSASAQITPATGNTGTFDGNNTDIRFDIEPLTDEEIEAWFNGENITENTKRMARDIEADRNLGKNFSEEIKKEVKRMQTLANRRERGNYKEIVKSSVDKLTDKFVPRYNFVTTASYIRAKREFSALLRAGYTYIANAKNLTNDELISALRPAQEWLWENVTNGITYDIEETKRAKKILSEIRKKKLYLPETLHGEIRQKFGLKNISEFTRAFPMFSSNIAKSNLTVDKIYGEYSRELPEYFSLGAGDDVGSSEWNELNAFIDGISNLRNAARGYVNTQEWGSTGIETYDGMTYDETVAYVKAEDMEKLIEGFYDVSERLSTEKSYKQEIAKLRLEHQNEVNTLKAGYAESLAKTRAELTAKLDAEKQNSIKIIEELAEKYDKNRRAKEIRSISKKIITAVKDTKLLLSSNSKTKHFENDYQPFAKGVSDIVQLPSADETSIETSKQSLEKYKSSEKSLKQELENIDLSKSTIKESEAQKSINRYKSLSAIPVSGRTAEETNELKRLRSDPRIKQYILSNRLENLNQRISALEATVEAKQNLRENRIEDIEKAYSDFEDKISEKNGTEEARANLQDYELTIYDTVSVAAKNIRDILVSEDLTEDDYASVLNNYRTAIAALKYANTESARERSERIKSNAQNAANEIVEFKKGKIKNTHEYRAISVVRNLMLIGNMQPYTYFQYLNSNTMKELWYDILDGEGEMMKNIYKSRQGIEAAREKYGYNEWNFGKKVTVQTAQGDDLTVSLGELMSIYANYLGGEENMKHMTEGGVKLAYEKEYTKSGREKKGKIPKSHPTYILTEYGILEAISNLTEEQKNYVKAVMSVNDELAKEGNKASRILYGIDLFTKDVYFAIHSSAENFDISNEKRKALRETKNLGMTNKRTRGANNTIDLYAFDDAMAKSIGYMAKFSGMAVPLDNMRATLNYKVRANDKDVPEAFNGNILDFKTLLSSAFNADTTKYIENLLMDYEASDIKQDGLIWSKLSSYGKKVAVALNSAVVAQQYGAIGRAIAVINPKYFIGFKASSLQRMISGDGLHSHNVIWEEVKKYNPIAIQKEISFYDMGIGRKTVDYLTQRSYDNFGKKIKGFLTDGSYRDEVESRLPALADEIAWSGIWNAACREQADILGKSVKSEDVKIAASKRFREVILQTQVYDSVSTRSQFMRSNSDFVRAATKFMAEPTKQINMLMTSILHCIQSRGRKGKKEFLRTLIALIWGNLLTSLPYAVIKGMRNNAKDKSFTEKYINAFLSNFMDNLNPLSNMPFFRDIISLLQGYDLTKDEYGLLTDVYKSAKKFIEGVNGNGTLTVDATVSLLANIATVFGVPARNAYRDAKGLVNTILSIGDAETTGTGIKIALKEAAIENIPFVDYTNAEKLYDAYVSGDKEQIRKEMVNYKSEESATNALTTYIANNDKEIINAGKALYNGDFKTYEKIYSNYSHKNNISKELMIKSLYKAANTNIGEDGYKLSPSTYKGKTDNDKITPIVGYSNVKYFFINGDYEKAGQAAKYIIDAYVEHGYKDTTAENGTKSNVKSMVKKYYEDKGEEISENKIESITSEIMSYANEK